MFRQIYQTYLFDGKFHKFDFLRGSSRYIVTMVVAYLASW